MGMVGGVIIMVKWVRSRKHLSCYVKEFYSIDIENC